MKIMDKKSQLIELTVVKYQNVLARSSRLQMNKRLLTIIGIIVICIVIIIVIAGYWFSLTWTGFSNKTLWDWMQLLIVPAVLAIGAFLFNLATSRNEQGIALDSQQETLLQSYLDRMSELLLVDNLGESNASDKTPNIARARTLTVLRRLDGSRKGSLLQFLYESRLIDKDNCIIHLRGADLSGADLHGIDLHKADLGGVDLSGADLCTANLSGAFLEEANLSGAKLSGAILVDAFMICADLREADLRNADLREVNLEEADLVKLT